MGRRRTPVRFAPEQHGERLDELARQIAVPLEPAVRPSLVQYAGLVGQWSARTDLTSARDSTTLCEVLLLDALVIWAAGWIGPDTRGVDVGAGAGAPAIPLSLLEGSLEMTLVEPRRRRVAFLRTAAGQLADLNRRVHVVEGSVDPETPSVPGMPFDVALSRATFSPAQWLSIGLGLAARVVVLTAHESPPEAPAGVRRADRRDYHVPSSAAPRVASLYVRT
jgi:16S rRNA (guanine527-N7)-methyltransferase